MFLVLTSSQNVNLNCFFSDVNGVYRCLLRVINISDDESQNIIIGGNHIFGRSNANVSRVDVIDSTTPFIISQLFTTFVNLEILIITASGLQRIQANAFTNAHNLRTLSMGGNPLMTLSHGMFDGLTNLHVLSVFDSDLETVDERTFDPLAAIEILFLSGNKIKSLPPNVFRPLRELYFLSLDGNYLESLHGDTFVNHPNLQQINLQNNSINALGANFLNNLNRLNWLNMENNRCVNGSWSVGVAITMEDMLRILQPCFDNFVDIPNGEVKTFTFELLGTLVIRDKNGNELMRL